MEIQAGPAAGALARGGAAVKEGGPDGCGRAGLGARAGTGRCVTILRASWWKIGLVAALISLSFLAEGASVTRAAGLARAEKRIIKGIEEQDAASRRLLERVVNINSGTLNLDGVREVGR